jgi:methyltransferase (TIGR00027 family)
VHPALPSVTALSVCFMRAREQKVTAALRILDDPYAARFLTPSWQIALSLAGARVTRLEARFPDAFPGLSTYVVARHRFIDDALTAALARGEVAQLVLLGAGYDSRAFRFAEALAAAGARVFEVDHPATGRRKRKVVEKGDFPAVDVVRVDCDFATQDFGDRLLAEGFVRGAPTFVVWEGVSMYLGRGTIRATLARIRELTAPGSWLAMDYLFLPDAPSVRGTLWRSSPSLLHLLGEPVTFFLHPEESGAFLSASAFDLVDLATPAVLSERYAPGRSMSPAMYVLTARSRA